ncbi:MAG: sulfotransferase domain-containing protein [Bacteroidetes bacterium]|nr:sulfotransferase domain-containing protein [Bacteroidota bacterium]
MPRTAKQYFRWIKVKLGLFDEGAFRLAIDEIRKDDTFIVSFPKSGNTWMRFLIANLISGEKEISFRNIDSIVPDIYSANEKVNSLSSPRFIKSHDAYFDLFPKCIYMVRDYRDVFVSFFHYHKALGEFKGEILDYLNAIDSLHPFGKWNEHVEKALAFSEKNPKKILLVKYEDLLADTKNEMERIISFAAIKPKRTVAEAIATSEFSALKEKEEKSGSEFRDRSGKYFFREGKSGGWKCFLPEAEAKTITDSFPALWKKLGY